MNIVHIMSHPPCWCPKPVLWEFNSFLMQTLLSASHVSENALLNFLHCRYDRCSTNVGTCFISAPSPNTGYAPAQQQEQQPHIER